jgi:hypothetical protein
MNSLDLVVVFFLGLAVAHWLFWRIMRQVHDHVQARLDFLQQHTIPIHIEVDGKMIYCYNTQTQEFLCQGTTVEQAQAAFQTRYPECWGIVHSGDAGIIQQWAQLAQAQHETGNHI